MKKTTKVQSHQNLRDEVLLRMLKTPPTPHAKMKIKKRKPKLNRAPAKRGDAKGAGAS